MIEISRSVARGLLLCLGAGLILTTVGLSPPPPPDYGGELVAKLVRLGSQGDLSNMEWVQSALGADPLERPTPSEVVIPRWLLPERILPGYVHQPVGVSIHYSVLKPDYKGPLRNWDRNCLAKLEIVQIEKYWCVQSLDSYYPVRALRRIPDIKSSWSVCAAAHYNYGYELQNQAGIVTELLAWGPDHGQEGCMRALALQQRRVK
jgi:hypothetical protein